MTNRGLHRLGLLYAAIPIPVLASIYDGYEVAATRLEQQHAINWLGIFSPRLSLALILAFIVYGLFGVADSFLYGFTESRSLPSLPGISSHRSRSS
jgi:hypothetical protein